MQILVIDDDATMTDLLDTLQDAVSNEVTVSNSGQEGVLKAKQSNPDLIILDLLLPDVDGWQICSQLREFTSAPILILSALDSPGLIASALDAGADDYLIKPVSRSMLAARVNRLIIRSRKTGNLVRRISLPTHFN